MEGAASDVIEFLRRSDVSRRLTYEEKARVGKTCTKVCKGLQEVVAFIGPKETMLILEDVFKQRYELGKGCEELSLSDEKDMILAIRDGQATTKIKATETYYPTIKPAKPAETEPINNIPSTDKLETPAETEPINNIPSTDKLETPAETNPIDDVLSRPGPNAAAKTKTSGDTLVNDKTDPTVEDGAIDLTHLGDEPPQPRDRAGYIKRQMEMESVMSKGAPEVEKR